MSFSTEIATLKKLGFFNCLPEKQLHTVAFEAEMMRLNKGRILYEKGEKADCAYVLLNGRIDLFERKFGKDDSFETYKVVYSVEAGALLGGFALISDKMRETGAYVAQRSDVLRIDCQKFRRQLIQHQNMRAQLSAYIVANFQTMLRKLEKQAKQLSSG